MPEIDEYFDDLIDILLAVDPTADYTRPPRFDIAGNQLGNLSLGVVYSDSSVLHVELQVDCSGPFPIWGDYGFQYEDSNGKLRFRYDNAPHHRELPNFPYHLHLSTGGLLPHSPPRIRQIAAAIRWRLDNPGQSWQATAD